MLNAHVISVCLAHLTVNDNGTSHEHVPGLLTASWWHPREDVETIKTILAISDITDGLDRDFRTRNYSERALFKQTNRGQSAIVVEVIVIPDKRLYENISTALSAMVVKPWDDEAFSFLEHLKSSSAGVVIGRGTCDLAAGTEGEISIELVRPAALIAAGEVIPNPYYEIESQSKFRITDTVNGTVTLQLKNLT